MKSILTFVLMFQISCNRDLFEGTSYVSKKSGQTKEKETEREEEPTVSKPTEITGTYLVCSNPTTPKPDRPESRVECSMEDQNSKKLYVKDVVDSYKFEHDISKESGIAVEFVIDESSVIVPFLILFKGSGSDAVFNAAGKARISFTYTKNVKTKSVIIQVGARTDLSFNYVDPATAQTPAATPTATPVSSPVSTPPPSPVQAKVATPEPVPAPTPLATPKKETCSGLAGGVWVPVPGDSVYGTSDFCVMKYSASQVADSKPSSQAGSVPWVKIGKSDAIAACESLGAGYHLLTNPEWMTVAANLASQSNNWSGGSVGNGMLSRGHNTDDPAYACAADVDDAKSYADGGGCTCDTGSFDKKRTKILSNGNVIWDIGGNVWNWINYYNLDDKPGPYGNEWIEFPSITGTATTPKSHLVPLASVQGWWNDSWNSDQGIGVYDPFDDGSEPNMLRGGSFWDDYASGLFTALFQEESSPTENIGFRCAFRP
ncbi:MAG: hypothetical protein HQK54_10445 [Oligoflexales bacterium]|nr:hypothetical protein [Oligoflexales bacterium]